MGSHSHEVTQPFCLTLTCSRLSPSLCPEALSLFQENTELLLKANKPQEWRPDTQLGTPSLLGAWGTETARRPRAHTAPFPPGPRAAIVAGAHLSGGGPSPEGSRRQV